MTNWIMTLRLVIYNQIVTWAAFAILAIFLTRKYWTISKHTFSNRCKLLGLLLTSFYQAEEEDLVGRGRNKDSVTAYHQSQNRGKRFGLRFIRQFTVWDGFRGQLQLLLQHTLQSPSYDWFTRFLLTVASRIYAWYFRPCV